MRKVATSCWSVLLVGGLLLPQAAVGAPGGLDSGFGGGDGKATIGLGGIYDAISWASALQPDGKIVLTGFEGPDLAVARLHPDGSPDLGFGTGGSVRMSISPGGGDEGMAVAIQPDGKIVVAGDAALDAFLVVRLHADGTPDGGFGTDGVVTTDITPGMDIGRDVAIQPDGKIIVGGESGTNKAKFSLVRYLSDGSLDPAFGDGGKVVMPFGIWGMITAIVLLPNGKIIAGGMNGNGFALAKFLSNGALDPKFGEGGLVAPAPDVPAMIADLTIDDQNRIVAVGDRDIFAVQVARYLPKGKLDEGFSRDGTMHVKFGTGEQNLRSVWIQPNGRILCGGYVGPHEYGSTVTPKMVAARLRPTGKLDRSFGGTGKVKVGFPGGAFGTDALLTPDGGFLLTGSASIDGTAEFAVARLLTS